MKKSVKNYKLIETENNKFPKSQKQADAIPESQVGHCSATIVRYELHLSST